MNLTIAAIELNQSLTAQLDLLDAIEDCLLEEDRFSFWDDGAQDEPTEKAAQRALAFVREWRYAQDEDLGLQYGLVCATNEVLALVAALNEEKAKFAARHAQYTQSVIDQLRKPSGKALSAHVELRERQLAIRALKKLLDVPGTGAAINLDAIDRKVPVIDRPVLRATWYRERSFSSTKADPVSAIAHLNALLAENPDDSRIYADLEIARSLPQDARFLKDPKPVTGQYCRLTPIRDPALSSNSPITRWGISPIFVLAQSGVVPVIRFIPPKVQDSGRDSPDLPQPFATLPTWYQRPPAKKVANHSKRKAHNPFAKTAYSGIWINVRKRNGCTEVAIFYAREGQSASSVSVGRQSLEYAWETACYRHIQSLSQPEGAPTLQTLKALQPSWEQVTQAEAWFIANRG